MRTNDYDFRVEPDTRGRMTLWAYECHIINGEPQSDDYEAFAYEYTDADIAELNGQSGEIDGMFSSCDEWVRKWLPINAQAFIDALPKYEIRVTGDSADTMWTCPKCHAEMLYWQEGYHLSNGCESEAE